MNAMNIHSILRINEHNSMKLLKSILCGSSSCKDFYFYIWGSHGSNNNFSTLFNRNLKYCDKYDISLVKYLLDDAYAKRCCKIFKLVIINNGLVDSLRHLLKDFSENDQCLTKLLLSPF